MQGGIYSVVADDETAQCSSTCNVTTQPAESNVDLRDEDMEQSVFGIRFALDPLTAPTSLHFSNSSLIVAYQEEIPPGTSPGNNVRRSTMTSDPGVTRDLPRVCADVIIARGQYYWEVDVYNSSIYRIGVGSLDPSEGWWLERHGLSFCTVYDGRREPLITVPPHIKTLGLFLNFGGGALSFYNPVTQEHLVTLPTCFNPSGVIPTLGVGQGWLRLRCGLPPPHYVFLSKNSAYRDPHGAGRGVWNRDMTFQSVRKMIQKFEELCASNSAWMPSA
uniref:probable E3 ubiquitin-protein ligase MID2 n=1 Tax=Doryrhamphus excisus TaxID=161450 RepID=UPI0025AE4CB4|nr:probable E3 ubiquitin-protein ligase MID2 [Doryrhamphus excisus]